MFVLVSCLRVWKRITYLVQKPSRIWLQLGGASDSIDIPTTRISCSLRVYNNHCGHSFVYPDSETELKPWLVSSRKSRGSSSSLLQLGLSSLLSPKRATPAGCSPNRGPKNLGEIFFFEVNKKIILVLCHP